MSLWKFPPQHNPWYKMTGLQVINRNGDVTLCCGDYDNYMLIGNILDMDLKQLFNSKAADRYRQIVAKKEYGKIACCSTCYSYIPMNK